MAWIATLLRIARLQKSRLTVLVGDGEDIDLWDNIEP